MLHIVCRGIATFLSSVAVSTKAYVCGRRSLAEMAGSNPAGGMTVSDECCVVRSLRKADPSSRGVQPSVSLSVIRCDTYSG